MEAKSYIIAVRMYKVLTLLNQENKWYNISYLSRQTGTSNSDRLKKQLDDLVKRNIIQYWADLTDDEKCIAKKKQTEEIIRTNNYKITGTGQKKLRKIRDSCLEPKSLMDIYE